MVMKKNNTAIMMFLVFDLLSMLMMSSCIRYDKLLKTEVPQGTDYLDKRDIAYNYVRSVAVYDEFITRALFSMLWLSDEVRNAYADIYCSKRGIQGDAREEFLKRQLEENNHWYAFYVLADVRDKTYLMLNEKNAVWTLSLDLGNKMILIPESVKEVDIEPEFQSFFGNNFTLFKTAYLVKFAKVDATGNVFNASDTVKLIVSSPYKKVNAVWEKHKLKKKGALLKNEDFYWC
jgi:hypothetical protein